MNRLTVTWEKVPSDIYAQRRLKSASLIRVFVVRMNTLSSLSYLIRAQWRSEQIARMRRLICNFSDRTCPKVRWLTLRLITLKEGMGSWHWRKWFEPHHEKIRLLGMCKLCDESFPLCLLPFRPVPFRLRSKMYNTSQEAHNLDTTSFQRCASAW